MSVIKKALEDYLSQKQNLGFKYQKQGDRLRQFVSFMEDQKAVYITVPLALAWATQSPGHQPSSAIALADIRGFSAYMRCIDSRNEIPPLGLIPAGGRRPPYLYKQKDIRRLLEATKSLSPKRGLRRWTYHCLLGLLAVTGMRISEAVGLMRDDVDLVNGILSIRNSKFGQSRLIPLHSSARRMLAQYESKRDAHLGEPTSPYFLVAEQGGRVWPQHLYPVFHQLCSQIGLQEASVTNRPRLMDFRHTFAVSTLLRWYRDGNDIESRLPVLSTFLGHSCIRDTYWYLSSCPELLGYATKRLENHWEAAS